jgi:tyrosyl-tRNA synthetase
VMAIGDNLIITYFTQATNIAFSKVNEYEERLKKENPINIKKELAFEIVKELYGEHDAKMAEEEFKNIVQSKELPKELETLEINAKENISIIDNLVKAGISPSRSEAKRLFEQGGVSVNNKTLTDTDTKLKEGDVLRIGKRRVVKISLK